MLPLLFLDMNANSLSIFPELHSPLSDRLGVQHFILRRYNSLNIDKPDVHTTVTVRTTEALHHILLRSLHQTQRKELRHRIPRQAAVRNKKNGLERRVCLGQALESGDVVLCYDVEG